MKYPYNINNITSSIALRATTNDSLQKMQDTVNDIIAERSVVLDKILKLKGVGKSIGGADSNFILIQILNKQGNPDSKIAHQVYSKLANERHVVVRYRGDELGCKGCLRITIGTKKENATLLDEFAKVLAKTLDY